MVPFLMVVRDAVLESALFPSTSHCSPPLAQDAQVSAADAVTLLITHKMFHAAVSLVVLFKQEIHTLNLEPLFVALTADCVKIDPTQPALQGTFITLVDNESSPDIDYNILSLLVS